MLDRKFIERACELAEEGIRKGNAPFGAVLVVDSKGVAEYGNNVGTTHDPTKHAKTGLISTFAPQVDRATLTRSILYTSSEPCIMCCGAILNAGISKVVYGTTESQFQLYIDDAPVKNPLTSREIIARSNPSVKVQGPSLEKEGLALHATYWPEAKTKWSGE